MPANVYPDTLTGQVAELLDRSEGHTLAPEERIPFSYAGALAVSTSPPWVPLRDRTVFGCRALLGTAGTSNTVVTVYVNGGSVGSVTLGSGATNVGGSLTATALAADTDVVTVGVTTTGAGAKDLTVLVRVA